MSYKNTNKAAMSFAQYVM